jgi:hypothetical protein
MIASKVIFILIGVSSSQNIILPNYLETGDSVSHGKASCAHVFHEECVSQWLSKQSSCPCCRKDMIIPPTMFPWQRDADAFCLFVFWEQNHASIESITLSLPLYMLQTIETIALRTTTDWLSYTNDTQKSSYYFRMHPSSSLVSS